ncbi:MAG: MaoC/PaaZ C-terminal domain-containing protein [Novosphingobium sp.]|nr:MaoC/PaaZ C-terminal domain-containing protein [Novosphingobium sp.]
MNLDKIRTYEFAPIEHQLSWRDTILYALGLGYGTEPLNWDQLQFAYEKNLKAVPSMACVMGYPGFWMREPELAIDWVKLLHGEHYYEILQPLPVEGLLTARHRVTGVEDKGEGRGAIVHFEKALYDEAGQLLARVEQSNFCRGDGGCGSFGDAAKKRPALPDTAPDLSYEIASSRQIALLYRLNGDYNPVHADPEVAREGGFDQPWIAGMNTMGMATRAAIAKLCDHDPNRVRSMFVRFSNVCFPGETLRFEFYRSNEGARFRAVAAEREVVVLDRGEVQLGRT